MPINNDNPNLDQGQDPAGADNEPTGYSSPIPPGFEGVSGERILQIGAIAVKVIRTLIAAGELRDIASRVSNDELETAEKYLELWAIYAGVADTEEDLFSLLAYFTKIKP